MVKVDIFSGFLGAGKTTLIKKLIAEAYKGEKIVLIENEFGDIGVDGQFLKESGVQINEMNSGCICCSLVGDFRTALNQVVEQFHPDRIIIEPSGVGKLSDIIKAVESADNDELELNSFTTVVDAKKCKMYMKNFGEFFNNQVENAGTIVLSHVNGLSQEKLDECVALLRGHNADAEIITTDWDELSGDQFTDAMEKESGIAKELERLAAEMLEEGDEEEEEEEDDDDDHDHEHHHDDDHDEDHEHDHEHHHHHHHHHHHPGEHDADEVFQSVGLETSHKYSKNEIEQILESLQDSGRFGDVLRAKGVVEDSDGRWIEFDYVPGEPDVRDGSAATTGMICVIGSGIEEDNVKEAFGLK
ncbi:MAG: CobW family GTP-binding protein [Eubacterium sp.]|jgi:G3E family GTPase